MSLTSLVFRNLTVLALTGKTLAGVEVRSSLLEPFNEEQAEPVPMIAVFTDHAKADDAQIEGNDILGANATVTLAIEIAVVARVPAEDGQGEELDIPPTDEGMEMTLDVIHRQALVELQIGQSIFAKLWRDCRIKTRGMVVERGASIEKGVRFAARRIEMQCQLLSEPTPGSATLPQFWADVLTAFDGDPRMSQVTVLLRKVVAGGALPSWRQWQAELGLTDGGIRGIGVVPYADTEGNDGEVTAVTQVTIEGKDRDEDFAVDEDKIVFQRGNEAPVIVGETIDG